MTKYTPVALIYDFDGTLAHGNMQERNFIPKLGLTSKKFWDSVASESKEHEADNISMYMKLMLEKAEAAHVQVRRTDFEKYGKNLTYFDGINEYQQDGKTIKGWFKRICDYGKESHLKIEHYIISSGIKSMIAGTPIKKYFKAIFASSFYYDHHGIAKWPSLVINYTTKTQFLFRINKGCLDVFDGKSINKYIPKEQRRIPFKHMIYIGDGDTDIPCFRLLKDRGGYSIAVYKPKSRGAKNKIQPLLKNGRVDYICKADYREQQPLDILIKAILDKISFDANLARIRRS